MKPRNLLWQAVLAIAVAVAGLGCGGDGKVKVSGVVTLDGQPVEGAMVTFIPVDPNKTHIAHGTTDKDGAFQLTTTAPNDGAIPGEYVVTVVYAEGVEAPPAKDMKEAFEGLEKAAAQKPKKPSRYFIPARYGDPTQSDLRQKVPPAGKVTLALSSK